MLNTRNLALLGGVAVLAIAGGLWTQNRERNSFCGDLFYVGDVHDEMREFIFEESMYLAALEAGAASDFVSESDREVYSTAASLLRNAVNEAEITGLMKHPNHGDLQNCHLRLTIGDILADFDLGQRTTLGIPVDRGFELVTRFEIRFEDLTGLELLENIEKSRKQYLTQSFQAGDVIEQARIAKLTRREFTLREPEFVQINYSTSATTDEDIEAGFLGRK
ncbi:MAG: hypothetical protein ACPGRH_06510 [Alphaproteobacteria bacterium]